MVDRAAATLAEEPLSQTGRENVPISVIFELRREISNLRPIVQQQRSSIRMQGWQQPGNIVYIDGLLNDFCDIANANEE